MSGQNHDIRSEQISTGGSEIGGGNSVFFWENQYEELKKIVMEMKPGQVETAGAAFTAMATRMYESVELIYKQARRLSEHWGGNDAVAAMKQMQKAYDQANEIYRKSHQTGSALETHAKMQKSWQESMGGGHWYGSDWMGVGGAAGLATRNYQAGQLMDQLQDQTVQSNNNFPKTIQADMPDTYASPFGRTPKPGGMPPGGGVPPGGGMPPGGGSLPSGGNLPDGGKLPGGGNLPDGGSGGGRFPGGGDFSGGGSELAGLPGGGGGGLGGGGLGAGGGLPGGGAGAGGGLPAGGVGAGGLAAGGLPGGLPGAGALGKNALGAGGMGGMPMGAGGGGQGGNEEERERTTWLTEDEDVWGADGDATPPVIG
ncbi:hypothetical protein [Actinomadura sp. HBU206391]|uniref:hypothetical protein n=1 Tax=Actinomadura sp. HBU206391 TaxID=2731692 RepID=UPI00164FB5EA|nr:hypothetical protein [Actinomadura sp. HBU206391]